MLRAGVVAAAGGCRRLALAPSAALHTAGRRMGGCSNAEVDEGQQRAALAMMMMARSLVQRPTSRRLATGGVISETRVASSLSLSSSALSLAGAAAARAAGGLAWNSTSRAAIHTVQAQPAGSAAAAPRLLPPRSEQAASIGHQREDGVGATADARATPIHQQALLKGGAHLNPRPSSGAHQTLLHAQSNMTDAMERISDRIASSQQQEQLAKPPPTEVGIRSVAGRKPVNEDRYSIAQIFPNVKFVAVYDGHGGAHAAEFAQQHLISSIVPDPVTGAVEAAQLVDAFEHVDAMFFKRFGPKAAPPLSDTSDGGPQTQSAATMLESGTTAVVAIIHNDTHVLLAHVGDSRALLSHRGTAIPLTYDHKPTRADESARIELAGGRIEGYAVQRVMGRLAMTRAIGDPHLKQYGIVPTPDVHARVLTDHDNFLVLASDGLFDVVSNDEVVDAVQEHQSVDEAAETLVNLALSYGSRDDITVAVVRLRGWEAFCVPSSTTKGFIQVNTRNMTRPSS